MDVEKGSSRLNGNNILLTSHPWGLQVKSMFISVKVLKLQVEFSCPIGPLSKEKVKEKSS